MALVQLNYFSNVLKTPVDVTVLLPEIDKKDEGSGRPEGEYRTVWLFHGMSSDHTTWLRRTDVDLFCKRHKIAFVMPGIGDNWYTNTVSGMRYFDYVTDELPQVCRSYFAGMSPRREMNLVAGCSMGGYGAVKAALHRPENYYGCISLGGALDITREGRKKHTELWRRIFDYNMQDESELAGTEHDLYHVARVQKEKGVTLPEFYLWCGAQDGLFENNRKFDRLLTELELPHVYKESEGTHSWVWWSPELENGLKYFIK
ncbi:MAG: hypothetical protein IKC69_07010 [Clostridia bacterium]|nr:hypothetical protein [Clostridia bacterium]